VSLSTRGISVIECLVALTVFSVGALGTVGTLALSTRLAGEARRATGAARQLAGELDRLELLVAVSGGACPATLPAPLSSLTGATIVWQAQPAPGGLRLQYVVGYPTARGFHADTGQGYLRCR
jgi:hypothetical protein